MQTKAVVIADGQIDCQRIAAMKGRDVLKQIALIEPRHREGLAVGAAEHVDLGAANIAMPIYVGKDRTAE